MAILNMRLDEDTDRRLTREAERARKTRSEVAREALTAYLSERERGRFRNEIARAARDLDPAQARALAEEALPLDNEALGAAEPGGRYRLRRKARRRGG
jgi:predicted transcriptional regulator